MQGLGWWENEEEQMAIIEWNPRITKVQLRLENGAPGSGWGLQDKKKKQQTTTAPGRWAQSISATLFVSQSISTMESTLAEGGRTVPFLREQS